MLRSFKIPIVGTLALVLVAALEVVGVSGAVAATINVSPGQSIQAAIDAANPGDTIVVAPGTYHENVQINKDNITLQGAGGLAHGTMTILVPPSGAKINHNACYVSNRDFDGICITDSNPASGTITTPVNGGNVSGFEVKGFSGIGIHAFGAFNMTIANNVLVNNGIDGIASLTGGGVIISDNQASGSSEAGIQVGDSPLSAPIPVPDLAELSGNSAFNDGAGIFAVDWHDASSFFDPTDFSKFNDMRGNDVEDNCIGILLVQTPSDPVTVGGVGIYGNTAIANNKTCPPGALLPATLSGTGIGDIGVADGSIRGNTVRSNVPSGVLPYSGGIVLAAYPGGPPVRYSNFSYNTMFGDQPFDFRYDGSGPKVNTFPQGLGSGVIVVFNNCDTSQPAKAPTSFHSGDHTPLCKSTPVSQDPGYPGWGPGN